VYDGTSRAGVLEGQGEERESIEEIEVVIILYPSWQETNIVREDGFYLARGVCILAFAKFRLFSGLQLRCF